MTENLLRDLLELLFVIALGAMLVSSWLRIRHGQITVPRCPDCASAISRAYPQCPKCGATRA